MVQEFFHQKRAIFAFLLFSALFFIAPFSLLQGQNVSQNLQERKYSEKMYFVTVADAEFYPLLLRLLSSIYKFHENQIGEIAVFDLGFTPTQKEELLEKPFVKVFEIEKTNPFIFTNYKVRADGRIRRGWYSWKPVVIKQALDMHPIVFYIDAGLYLTGPLDLFFQHVQQNGYFLCRIGHTIGVTTTNFVKEKFKLITPERAQILDQQSLAANFQGLSRQVYDTYVMPMYELSKDIRYFVDDGSAPWGFGGARHDQTLFSIIASLHNMKSAFSGSPTMLHINGKNVILKPIRSYVHFNG